MDKTVKLGVCYYPEHWPETEWEDDLKRMLENGIDCVRIAEFAWNLMEPEQGVYDFSLFDRFLDLAQRMEMKVILGTPTATPPVWVSQPYPEILNADRKGHVYPHGLRRHYTYNSPVYQKLSRNIVEKMGERYGHHPAVIGWQIDNEINCEVNEFFSPCDHQAFQAFLKEKYQTIDRLNDAWGTVFWNQQYSAWDQIALPTHPKATNPHQHQDMIRFFSWSARRFVLMQSEILRKTCDTSRQFITTNGLFGHLDSHAMTKESLDFLCYDSYPNFAWARSGRQGGEEWLYDREWSANLTHMRSVSPDFSIMEQQSGPNGWVNGLCAAPAPKPGQMTLWSMQSIAHGANNVSFFRWRTCSFGTEIYWHGILDADSCDNRRLAETRRLYDRLVKLPQLHGARYLADVAVAHTYDNDWDEEVDEWHRLLAEESSKGIFRAGQLTHTPFDEIYLDHCSVEDMLQYKAIVFPHAVLLSEEAAAKLERYVQAGGTLLLGARAGLKDTDGHIVRKRLPGKLQELCGLYVEEGSFVHPQDEPANVKIGQEQAHAAVWQDDLHCVNAMPLAQYEDGDFAGRTALAEHAYGMGRVYTWGSTWSEETFASMLAYLGLRTPWQHTLQLTPACELAVRDSGTVKTFFALNYSAQPQEIQVIKPLWDAENSMMIQGARTLAPYEALVLQNKE